MDAGEERLASLPVELFGSTVLTLGRPAAGRRTRPPAQGVARILIVVAGRVFPAAFPAADRHVRPPDTLRRPTLVTP